MTAQKPVGGEAPAGHPRPRAAIQGATVHHRYLGRRLELPILSRSAASATRVIAHPNPGRQRISRLKVPCSAETFLVFKDIFVANFQRIFAFAILHTVRNKS